MMKINKVQDVKDLKDKISELYSKAGSLTVEADRLSQALAKITERETAIKSAEQSPAQNFTNLAELSEQNARDYGEIGLKGAQREAYFESARYRTLEINSIKSDLAPKLEEGKLTWTTVAMDGLATFASKSTEHLEKLGKIVMSANRAIWALETALIAPVRITDEMAATFDVAQKSSYALGVYHFRRENAERISANAQESIGYIQYSMNFMVYSTLLRGKSEEEATKFIKDTLRQFSTRYDAIMDGVRARKETFEEDADLFLGELRKKKIFGMQEAPRAQRG